MSTTHETDDMVSDDEAVGPPGDTADEPGERLSWTRVGIVVVVVALIAGGVALFAEYGRGAGPAGDASWSVPYVDVTLTPSYQFQSPLSNPARDVALAFVVADPRRPCAPSWGGAYSLDSAATDLELDRRITQLRAAGGDIMVSFGGEANDELAFACTDEAALRDAYRSVVERYSVDAVDLDIEGDEVGDTASVERRANAIAAVQKERAAAGAELAVWVTLPVTTAGLTPDGVAVVRAMLVAGVDLTGVNAMTMNFGDPQHPAADMLGATKKALEATATQIGDLYAGQGVTLSEVQTWAKVGATPMIGQNDVAGEIFTLDDARGLADFAIAKGLGRVSTWSLNRDAPCSPSFADVLVLSNTCSSVDQQALDFANVFTKLPGRAPSVAPGEEVTVTDPPQVIDDEATSPYPIWRPDAQYPSSYKVVRRGMVYEAKWYTQGSDPAMVTANPWESPWSLIGPVSPDDEPYAPTTVAAGTHPDWSPLPLYEKGDKVLFDGLPYEARWPNQGEPPSTLFPVGPDSAWDPLFTLPGEPTEP